MKRSSTIILKSVVIIIGLVVLGLCLYALPRLIISELYSDFDYGYIFLGMYLAAMPFFIALYHALKLLRYIDNNQAFSSESVRSLGYIKYCGFVISGLYAIGMPYIFHLGDKDDAPGVVLVGLVLTFAPLAVAVLAAVLQKFLQDAINIKNENDLTV